MRDEVFLKKKFSVSIQINAGKILTLLPKNGSPTGTNSGELREAPQNLFKITRGDSEEKRSRFEALWKRIVSRGDLKSISKRAPGASIKTTNMQETLEKLFPKSFRAFWRFRGAFWRF